MKTLSWSSIKESGVDAYAFARFCPSTTSAISDMFTPLEYKDFLQKMWSVFSELADNSTKFMLKDHLWLLLMQEIGLFVPQPTNGITVAGCGACISHLTVLPNGIVHACRRFDSPLGKLPEESLYDIFVGKKADKYRDVTQLEKCASCELLHYCRGCMAVAHCTTGRHTAPDPQCWK